MIERLFDRIWCIWQYEVRNIHALQHRACNPTLNHMLRFIGTIGLTAPADEQEHRDAVHVRRSERDQRIYEVPQSRVLQIDQAWCARTKIMTSGKTNRCTLVCGDAMIIGFLKCYDVAIGLEQNRAPR